MHSIDIIPFLWEHRYNTSVIRMKIYNISHKSWVKIMGKFIQKKKKCYE